MNELQCQFKQGGCQGRFDSITKLTRLDYQPLFGKMSPHSSPERAAGRVRFPLLVLANHVTACRFSYGKDCPEIVAEIITSKIDPSHGEAILTAQRH